MAAHDPDKHVAAIISAPGSAAKDELLFLRRALLDPRGLWVLLNPASRVGGEEKEGEDVDEEGENEADRNARLRIGALGALGGILGTPSLFELALWVFIDPFLQMHIHLLPSHRMLPWKKTKTKTPSLHSLHHLPFGQH